MLQTGFVNILVTAFQYSFLCDHMYFILGMWKHSDKGLYQTAKGVCDIKCVRNLWSKLCG